MFFIENRSNSRFDTEGIGFEVQDLVSPVASGQIQRARGQSGGANQIYGNSRSMQFVVRRSPKQN